MSKKQCGKCGNYNEYNCYNNKQKFIAEARTQFTVIVNSETLCNLLTLIGNEDISLDGFLLQSLNDNCTLFTFTVGDANGQPSTWVGIVRCILKKLCINYLESDVAKITASSSGPGTLAKIYCALSDELDVYSSYNGDTNIIFIETDCIDKAIKIIEKL